MSRVVHMPTPYTPPEFLKDAFNCPHCNAFAHHHWDRIYIHQHTLSGPLGKDHCVATCARCSRFSIWIDRKLVHPVSSIAPLPIEDMPDDVKGDYNEAREVLNSSPRAAVALLRLALQKLMHHLGEKGKDLNTDIGNLVKKGLPQKVQEALDCIRVIGNNAVHPGQIDLKDDINTAIALFGLLNMIVEIMITQPAKVSQIFNKLPENTIAQIKQRDTAH